MTRRLDELLIERGRLEERITTQRYVLRHELKPVRASLAGVDRGVARVHAFGRYLKGHPGLVLLGLGALLFMKSGRLLRWAKRGFFVWQSWRTLRERLAVFGARMRS